MDGFGKLPSEIIRKIAVEHLDNQEDFESFKQVCSLWKSGTEDIRYIWPRKNIQLPWLMLVDPPDNISYRRFYSLSKLMFRQVDLPRFDEDPDDNRRYFSSEGWLISVSMKRTLIHFFDVFSSKVITPPTVDKLLVEYGGGEEDEGQVVEDEDEGQDVEDDGQDVENEDEGPDESYIYLSQFYKFIFSNRPTASSDDDNNNNNNDFQVAMLFKDNDRIAFWRPGQHQWLTPDADFEISLVYDVCFFRGEFYSIDHFSKVIAYGSGSGSEIRKQARVIADLKSQGLTTKNTTKFYIVGLETTLLVIHRRICVTEDDKVDFKSDDFKYWTQSIELFEVNLDDGKATRVYSIGDRALFVGRNSTFFVDACPSDQRGCKPNCIYITDDNNEYYFSPPRGGGEDMGIFSLDENKVVGQVYEGPSQFDRFSPPMWVQLPPY